jgi:hypothetical protein
MKSLKQKLTELNLPVDTRYSDLFVQSSEDARRVIREHKLESAINFVCESFVSKIDGKQWIEIAGMNVEYFLEKENKKAN